MSRPILQDDEAALDIRRSVADEATLAQIPPRALGKGTLCVAGGIPFTYNPASVSAAEAGACVVPNAIAASDAYIADPASAAGRWEAAASKLGGNVAMIDLVCDTNLAGTRTGNVLLANGNGALGKIDNVTVTSTMLVLLIGQITGADNGLWIFEALGGSGKWQARRAPGFDTSAEFVSGQVFYVKSGLVYGGQKIALTTAAPITLNTTALTYRVPQSSSFHTVRGVVTGNVSLTAFAAVAGGTPDDGNTYGLGQRVLLVGQTTPEQNGIYVVGPAAAGVAPLYRAADWQAGSVQPSESVIRLSEGTYWSQAGKEWFASATGGITVGTTDPAFYPKRQRGTATLVAGTKTVNAALVGAPVYVLAGAHVNLTAKTPGGTQGFLSYGTPTANHGAGAFTATSSNNADTSVVAFEIVNG